MDYFCKEKYLCKRGIEISGGRFEIGSFILTILVLKGNPDITKNLTD